MDLALGDDSDCGGMIQRRHHDVDGGRCQCTATPGARETGVCWNLAMNELGRIDPRKVHVVEMRFFDRLNVEETAEALKVSTITVKRDWRAARAWLYWELAGGEPDGFGTLETS